MPERPLTDNEQAIFARHQRKRDALLAQAREQQDILSELALVAGGDGCQIDLDRGVLILPEDDDADDG